MTDDDTRATTTEARELIRREMAAELADWIRAQCRGIGYTRAKDWSQLADKIDPRKVPSRNGLRSYWNQGETW